MDIVKFEQVDSEVLEIRGVKVILDNDLAELYGVETKRINEAVKNNPDKFPEGYLFELSKSEWSVLKSKFSTSNRGGKVKLPSAFTEKGLYMLATILKSPQNLLSTNAHELAGIKINSKHEIRNSKQIPMSECRND